MAIDTDNKKLAVMEMEDYWEPAIPLLPGAFSQGDQQQLLWGYPGILWSAAVGGGGGFDRITLGYPEVGSSMGLGDYFG